MRRAVIFGLALALALALAGCSKEEFDPSTLGWEEDWTTVGTVLAAEPMEGFDANENKDALGPSGLWYASWTAGEGEDYVNADGKDATLYDAQIYVLVEECKNSKKAAADVTEWESIERDSYECGESVTGTYAGQDFTVVVMNESKNGNPYSHGAAAFAARGKYAFSVELLCREEYEGDAVEMLATFLSGLHYNDEEAK